MMQFRRRAGDMPEGNSHFFAIFLLSEFQAAEALPVIVEAFSLPGELPFDLFGDTLFYAGQGSLPFFAGDHPEVLDALIGDKP